MRVFDSFWPFIQKVLKIDASNFPEMFIGSLSTTFIKTVWRFLHIDGSQIKKYAKNEVFRHFLENAWKFLAEISYLDSSQHYLQLFYRHQAREISSSPILKPFLDLTAVNMRQKWFFSKSFQDRGFKLSRNVPLTIIYNFCKDSIVIFAYWRHSNQKDCDFL